jgi:cardiolipin synthase
MAAEHPLTVSASRPASLGATGPSFARALWRIAAARVTSGNSVRLLVDGPETFAAMHASIAAARSSVDFEQYYYGADNVGRSFTDALCAAARRGVKVRVLVDWVGARRDAIAQLREVEKAGGELRVFNPPGFRRWFGILPRDHRKVLVVDKRVGVTGGVGISEVWSRRLPTPRSAPWRDMSVEIRGPASTDLARAFLVTWRRAYGERASRAERQARLAPSGSSLDPGREPPSLVGIVEGEPGRARVARALQLTAVAAERSIWVATAYFLPSLREIEALVGAARDGVDVRLLVPNKNDHYWMTRLARRFYPHLLKGGVRIWEWGGAMMHAKMSVTDARMTRLGSTDFNPLGVTINYELDAFIDDPEVGAAASRQFLADLDGSFEVTILKPSAARSSRWIVSILTAITSAIRQ